MSLTFEFIKPFEFSLIACSVVLKIMVYLHVLTFHDEEEEE